MKRRTFLQLSGMTAASSVLAGCQSGNEKLIPFLIPPDEGVTPGKAEYYASSCRFCPAGCGILLSPAAAGPGASQPSGWPVCGAGEPTCRLDVCLAPV